MYEQCDILYNGILLSNKSSLTTNMHNKWMNFRSIILSARSQTQKTVSCIWLQLYKLLGKAKLMISGCQGIYEGLTAKGHKGTLQGDRNVYHSCSGGYIIVPMSKLIRVWRKGWIGG